MNTSTQYFATEDPCAQPTDDTMMRTIRALRPKLNHDIKNVLVPRKTKLYDRYIQRFIADNNIYHEYSN